MPVALFESSLLGRVDSSRQPVFWPRSQGAASPTQVGHPSVSSEFPHDNAEIAGGAIWICAELTGPATALVPEAPYEPVPSERFVLLLDDEVPSEGPLELALDGRTLGLQVSALDAEPEPSAPADPPAFVHFETALVAALMAQGATRSAALVPRLLRLEPLPADALGKDVRLTLQSRGYLDGSARYSAKYRELCAAWVAVLRGESQDFGACGTTTLDRFGGELLAALLALPATRADELRRELRKAGIAAFGVLEAA